MKNPLTLEVVTEIKESRKEYYRMYRAKHRDKLNIQSKKYRDKNKDAINEKCRARYHKKERVYKEKENKPETVKKKINYMSDQEYQNYFNKPLRNYA